MFNPGIVFSSEKYCFVSRETRLTDATTLEPRGSSAESGRSPDHAWRPVLLERHEHVPRETSRASGACRQPHPIHSTEFDHRSCTDSISAAMDAERALPQPSFGHISESFGALSEQFALCANLPAVDGGAGLMRSLETITNQLVQLNRKVDAVDRKVGDLRTEMTAEYVGLR